MILNENRNGNLFIWFFFLFIHFVIDQINRKQIKSIEIIKYLKRDVVQWQSIKLKNSINHSFNWKKKININMVYCVAEKIVQFGRVEWKKRKI